MCLDRCGGFTHLCLFASGTWTATENIRHEPGLKGRSFIFSKAGVGGGGRVGKPCHEKVQMGSIGCLRNKVRGQLEYLLLRDYWVPWLLLWHLECIPLKHRELREDGCLFSWATSYIDLTSAGSSFRLDEVPLPSPNGDGGGFKSRLLFQALPSASIVVGKRIAFLRAFARRPQEQLTPTRSHSCYVFCFIGGEGGVPASPMKEATS